MSCWAVHCWAVVSSTSTPYVDVEEFPDERHAERRLAELAAERALKPILSHGRKQPADRILASSFGPDQVPRGRFLAFILPPIAPRRAGVA